MGRGRGHVRPLRRGRTEPVRIVRAAALIVGGALVVGTLGWVVAGGVFQTDGAPGRSSTAGAGESGASEGPPPTPTPQPPIGGTELYGFVPYWEMTATTAAYLDDIRVSTLALFSVHAARSGSIAITDIGYHRINGPIGRRLVAEAHARHQRVDLTFTSFGRSTNARFFGTQAGAADLRLTAAQGLVGLATKLGFDGLNLDVEQLDPSNLVGYRDLIADIRFVEGTQGRTLKLTVATQADHSGALAAQAAIQSGADRVFLMGYDYHWSGSSAGASSPIHSLDGAHDLFTSIVDYVQSGVPRDRILLGLPLYGMSWPVDGPDLGDPVAGRGTTFIPSQHLKQLTADGFSPQSDDPETAEWFVTSTAAPSQSPGASQAASPTAAGIGSPLATLAPGAELSPEPTTATLRYTATFYDSPRTLLAKLELARAQGLAGGGFWALGYERGLPGYGELMADFTEGRVGTGE